jgi:hypothetical protein
MLDAMTKNGGDPTSLKGMIDRIKQCMVAGPMTVLAGVVTPPPGSANFSMAGVNILAGDAKAIMQQQDKAMAVQQEIFGFVSRNSPVEMTMVRTPAAKTVDGVVFDDFSFQMKAKNSAQAPASMAPMLGMLAGAGAAHRLVGMVDDGHVLAVSQGDDALISSVIAAIKANSDPLDARPQVAAVAAKLPAMRLGVGYVSMDAFAQIAMRYARMFSVSVPLELPPDMPPVGFTVASDGSAVRIDCYTSAQTIKGLISAALEVVMHMNGGAHSGGGL